MIQGPRSEATRAIYAFIKEHGPVKEAALAERFQADADADDMAISVWLKRRLYGMADANFIDFTPGGWVAKPLPEPKQRKVRAPGEPPAKRGKAPQEAVPADQAHVAQPNRRSMFEGGPYVPPVQVHRAGSMEYAACPSIISGSPRTYRRGW